jgi:hypothetical protein
VAAGAGLAVVDEAGEAEGLHVVAQGGGGDAEVGEVVPLVFAGAVGEAGDDGEADGVAEGGEDLGQGDLARRWVGELPHDGWRTYCRRCSMVVEHWSGMSEGTHGLVARATGGADVATVEDVGGRGWRYEY